MSTPYAFGGHSMQRSFKTITLVVGTALVAAVAFAQSPLQPVPDSRSGPQSAPLPVSAAKQANTTAASEKFAFAKARHPELGSSELTISGERISFFTGHVPPSQVDAVGVAGSKALARAAGSTLSSAEFVNAAIGLGFIVRYEDLFGVQNAGEELVFASSEVDELGMTHVSFQQVYQGVEVFQSTIDVHVGPGGSVKAAGNQFVPGLHLASVTPAFSKALAQDKVRRSVPGAKLTGEPRLVVYPQREKTAHPIATLAWLVETYDAQAPSRLLNVIDAYTGRIVDAIELIADAQNRKTYYAAFTNTLPGTLARSEGQGPLNYSGLLDIDRAHDRIGATYAYFLATHGRDSWDGAGAQCTTSTYYRNLPDQGQPSEPFQNAYWDGESQWVFGENMASLDVVAHEFTHAVTQTTANLVYRFQSGALNESMSDVFGMMVDRDDWTIGEETSLGTLRNIADPASAALGTRAQPAHTSAYYTGCADCGGVHTNSGIPNRAFYLVATALTNAKAEKIYFRALRYYLQERSHFKDARAALIQAATDLYGCAGNEVLTLRNAFNSVGVVANWEPPASSCNALTCLCSATVATSDPVVFPTPLQGLRIAATLYKTRDTVLASGDGKYYAELFHQNTGRMALLMLNDAQLRLQFGRVLAGLAPGLDALSEGRGSSVRVPPALTQQLVTFFAALAAADRAQSGGVLAALIEAETHRISLPALSGLTYAQAWSRFEREPQIREPAGKTR
ncbi:MAG: M4 family metallopeptidase [Lysobacterales bacterium]